MNRVDLGDDDGALIITKDGGATLILPRGHSDDDMPWHLAFISAVACRSANSGWVDEQISWMEEYVSGDNRLT